MENVLLNLFHGRQNIAGDGSDGNGCRYPGVVCGDLRWPRGHGGGEWSRLQVTLMRSKDRLQQPNLSLERFKKPPVDPY